ncbi:inhibitor of nuclear factor kappa-B kinase-interacting protein-like [Rhinatrema bivittatum]|uniref:inhibitor of nuclear factor kappa-B kinase-interacting protein-like n=1 Tax=Rhinatrema bivittatum TaxID=194408 RepID=UPI00112996C3|nr:inhibitor of nuclear factor kappa-B kinase-interacting protein-like [Rhinatrema bivittatum]
MASATLVPRLEEQVSRVRNTMHHIQDAQEKTSRDLQSLREKLQSEKDACRLYQHEVDLSLVTLKSEVKSIHSQLTFKINSAEQGVKSLTERVRELEDGTRRNIQTVKRQEEDELFHVEKQLQHSSQAAETLETEQNTLFAKTTDLNQKLSDCEPKVSEFRDHFPAVEGAVVAVLRVSNELMSRKKKTEEMALQMFNMENKMVKVVSDILDMQRALERL